MIENIFVGVLCVLAVIVAIWAWKFENSGSDEAGEVKSDKKSK